MTSTTSNHPGAAFGIPAPTINEMRGIRFLEGDGTDDKGAGAGTPPAATPPAAPAATPPAAPAGKVYTPEETEAYIKSLRGEAQTNREKAEAAERTAAEAKSRQDAVLIALGLKADGSAADPDPAALAAELATKAADVETTKRENLVLRVAPGLSANADRLLDSRAFNSKLSAISVDDKTSVETLINEFVSKDDSYKVTSAAGSSGGASHTGTQPTNARPDKATAYAAAMSRSKP